MTTGDLVAVLADLVEEWRDDAWEQQHPAPPELRDLTYRHVDTLNAILEDHCARHDD